MNPRRILGALMGSYCAVCVCLAAQSGPDDRVITDPHTITSAANPEARPVPIEDLYFTKNTFGPAWSPDGKEIAFTSDLAGRPNLWKVPAAGGWPIQLTQSNDRQYGGTWSPDGKWIVYEQDAGGNEMWDLYSVPSDGGAPINLTNTPDIREGDPRWSHDGKTIACSYKTKTGTQYDIALMDWSTRKVHKLTNEQEPGFNWSVVAWSSDDRTIYAGRGNPQFTDADIYRIDVATGNVWSAAVLQAKK
jgi:Tol biopolymer transport system component